MIRSFKNKELESLYDHGPSRETRKIPASLNRAAVNRLAYLEAAKNINDLRCPPANRLEALSGDLKGFYSIRVNDQFRLIFRWIDNAAQDIDLVDYH